MKRIACGCLALFAVASILGYYFVSRAARTAVRPAVEYEVRKGDFVVDVSESGAIEPIRVVEIKSKASGRVAALKVEEGDIVEPGQLLAQIDPREIQEQVDQGRAQTEIAEAGTRKAAISFEIQEIEARTQYEQARLRLEQAKKELDVQPALTTSSLVAARSNLEAAKQARDMLLNVTQPQQSVEFKTAVDDAEAALAEAERNLTRAHNLFSQQQLDAAKTAHVAAKSRLAAARERLSHLDAQQRLDRESAQSRLEAAEAESKRAEAGKIQDEIKRNDYLSAQQAVRSAEARLRQIELAKLDMKQSEASQRQSQSSFKNLMIQFGETDLRSPMRGVVTKRYREVGELVMSGTAGFGEGTPVMQVADLSKMRVKLYLNELDVPKIKPGLKVEVKVDAVKDRKFEGRVEKVAPAAETSGQEIDFRSRSTVVRYVVEALIDNPDARLRPGMTARCRIIVSEKKGVLLLPLEAIGEDKGQKYVLLIDPVKKDEKGKPVAERKEVKVGMRGANDYEVLSGVKAGEKVRKPPFTGPRREGFNIEMD
ncbi:MAG: efflux RND transporter periplasmic adaptor subunit [Armatimonadetes bacterium]|nr:efflux RND transporter periplasmic adaptor subunit [Armatimonadota bacterium]